MDARARLTPIDMALFAVVLGLMGILAQPWYAAINTSTGNLSAGQEYLFLALYPVLVLTIMTIVWQTAVSGGGA